RRPVAVSRVYGRLADRDLAREVAAHHARLGGDALSRLRLRQLAVEDPAAHRALRADVPHERARVDAGDARDPVRLEPAQPARLRRSWARALRMPAPAAWMRPASIAASDTP